MNFSLTEPQQRIAFDGNSYMNYDFVASANLINGFRFSTTCYPLLTSAKKLSMENYSVGGRTTTTMITPSVFSQISNYIKKGDVVFFWEIANDLGIVSAAQAYANCITYCGMVRALGAKVVIASTIPSSGPNEAAKLTVDANIRANWPTFADAFCDFRSQTHFQTVADVTDPLYYNQTDTTHLTRLGYDTLAIYAAPIASALF